MTKKPATTPPEVCLTAEDPDEALRILWRIARDPGQSGTARVAACRLLLVEAREHAGGEARHGADLNRRALALMESARRAN